MVTGMILGGHAVEVVAIAAIVLIVWGAVAVIRVVRAFMAGASNTAPQPRRRARMSLRDMPMPT